MTNYSSFAPIRIDGLELAFRGEVSIELILVYGVFDVPSKLVDKLAAKHFVTRLLHVFAPGLGLDCHIETLLVKLGQ